MFLKRVCLCSSHKITLVQLRACNTKTYQSKKKKKKERQPVVEIVEIHEDPIVECMKFAYHLEAIIPKKMEILYMGSQAYSVW